MGTSTLNASSKEPFGSSKRAYLVEIVSFCNSSLLVRSRDIRVNVGYAEGMDINKMLADLRTEREQITEAILVLERLTAGQGKRRGRPPKWMTEVKGRGRPKGSKNKPKTPEQ